jgi:hypothetical protein
VDHPELFNFGPCFIFISTGNALLPDRHLKAVPFNKSGYSSLGTSGLYLVNRPGAIRIRPACVFLTQLSIPCIDPGAFKPAFYALDKTVFTLSALVLEKRLVKT